MYCSEDLSVTALANLLMDLVMRFWGFFLDFDEGFLADGDGFELLFGVGHPSRGGFVTGGG